MCDKCGSKTMDNCGSGGGCGSGQCGSCGSQDHACEPQGDWRCGQCGPDNEMPTPEQMFGMFMDLADRSWMKLMKQKMMAVCEKKIGKHMDQMAELYVDACMMKWMDYAAFQKKKPEFMKRMQKLKDEKKK